MGGISTSTGIFSGIDSANLINQLLAIEARPANLIQSRIIELQTQQATYLDLNSRIGALRDAARAFRLEDTFDARSATSSNEDVLRVTAANSAAEGTYGFIVDRLVTTQQLLSRGFVDQDVSGLGATSFTFESERAALNADVRLDELNAGAGVDRGIISITQGSNTAEIDLSRVASLQEAVDAINNASGIDVTATITGKGITLDSTTADFTVSDTSGDTTAADLGIAGSSTSNQLVGSDIYVLGANTALAALNDGNGVFISDTTGTGRSDFTINVDTTAVKINIGDVFDTEGEQLDGPASTLGEVIDRINTQLADAGVTGVSVQVASSGDRLELLNTSGLAVTIEEAVAADPSDPNVGTTTAADLGLLQSSPTTTSFTGARVLAGAADTLISSINGRQGLSGDGTFTITARDASIINVDISAATSVQEVIDTINAAGAGSITASINNTGSGLRITDNTGGTSDLIISGTTAESLGIATTGVAEDSIESNLNKAYITRGSRLADVGIGTGTFVITDGDGNEASINIGTDTVTFAQLIDEANSQLEARGVNAFLRINDSADGIIVEEPAGTDAAGPISISDSSGSIARDLRIAGEAAGTGDDNFINGSLEITVEFDPADTLEDVINKINEADVGFNAAVINTGAAGAPFRISLIAENSGAAGRTLINDNGFGLQLETLERGDDARIFFGADDAKNGVLITSSTNTLDDLVTGVSIDLAAPAPDETTSVTITKDIEEFESKVNSFVTAFNSLVERIDFVTRFDTETEERGALLNDATARQLRAALFSTIQDEAINPDGSFTRLLDVGIEFGEGGSIVLDSERFREALEQDFDGVRSLFDSRDLVPVERDVDLGDGVILNNAPASADEFTSLGVAGLVEELADRYVDSIDGILTLRRNAVESQITLQETRLEDFDERLQDRRAILEAQFLAMERAIGSLQSQQQALLSLNG